VTQLALAAVCIGALAFGANARASGADAVNYSVQIDQIEQRWGDGANRLHWDLEGWVGGDTNRLWYRSEGDERMNGPSGGEFELQLLYSRHVSPFWDFQVGVARDEIFGSGTDHQRTRAVIGFDGLAPYWFEVEPALLIGDGGDIAARLTTTLDLFITQRLIAQPRFEINSATKDATDFGIKSGVNNIELGLRLRYEVRREFAPYVGVSWIRKLGKTEDLARDEGEEYRDLSFVLGVRLWF
jgi:copper resistance protein B